MEKTFTERTSPEVCSESVRITLENNLVRNVEFRGGCPGNLAALSVLVAGMPAEEVIRKLRGIRCGVKSTSCADQLAKILSEHLAGTRKNP